MSGLEALGNAIRVFVERDLIPFVISIVAAIFVLAITPNDYWPLNKISNTLYFIGVFGIAFLLVKLFIFLAKKLISKNKLREHKQREDQRIEKDNENAVELFWSATDHFSPDDRHLIREFVKSENSPIERDTNEFNSHGCLLRSDYIVSTVISNPYQKPISISRKDNDTKIYVPVSEFIDGVSQYILRDEIYEIAKYSMDRLGRYLTLTDTFILSE